MNERCDDEDGLVDQTVCECRSISRSCDMNHNRLPARRDCFPAGAAQKGEGLDSSI